MNYDCEINYHPGKANVVASVLSKKSTIELDACQILHIWTPYFANVNLLAVFLFDVLV
jgi:hypothetical protein